MLDLLKKTYLMGLGLASLTRERIEEFVEELVRRGEVAEKDRRQVLDDLIQRAREEQKRISETIREMVGKVIQEMGVPTRKEYEALLKRVEALENRLSSPGSEKGNVSTSQGA